jgi:hypothetical protein
MSTPPHTPPDTPADTRARGAGAGTWGDVDVHRLHARVMGRLFGEPAAPTMIGRFHVERRLGEGAMGVVYAAVDAQLNRRVAIKLLHPHLQGDDQGRARLLREARAMARLEHEHVARIYEVGAWGDQIYIAMELIEGVTLEACTTARRRRRRRRCSSASRWSGRPRARRPRRFRWRCRCRSGTRAETAGR